ncbi:hypothetical protein LPY66_11330 [Dehalobacter sp. DCM]|uniref:hypothetical protein n=1 Tax=Dehalobacter sp. DCM TaxID=2907827 RepID=UPI003081D254|nr:hypothetical protein LPY66_11330 [Dehalobacter sp. DCM]
MAVKVFSALPLPSRYKKWASGTVVSSGSQGTFTYLSGATTGKYYLSVSGLGFRPTFIYVFYSNGTTETYISVYSEIGGDLYSKPVKVVNAFNTSTGSWSTFHFKGDINPCSIQKGSFTIPVQTGSSSYKWLAVD